MQIHDPSPATARLAFDETPATADDIDIDLDRVVWDPDYRSLVRDLLVWETCER